jgi:ABC-type methionine transport system ATPase subunit
MTVFENVAFAMRVVGASKRDIRKRVTYALSIVGLNEKARNYPDELSGGEQQRVALARALVNNPTMIIADEPTGNVDPTMSYEIVDLLTEINRRGTTVIMVTHEHQLVRDFGHRVVMIEDGQIVADNAGLTNNTLSPENENKPQTLQSAVFDEVKEAAMIVDSPMEEIKAEKASDPLNISGGFVIDAEIKPEEDESNEV